MEEFKNNKARWRMQLIMLAILLSSIFIVIYTFMDFTVTQNVNFVGSYSQKVKVVKILSKCSVADCYLAHFARRHHEKCPYKCVLANSKEHIYNIDAFLFHAPKYFRNNFISSPGSKRPHQKYVFFNREAHLYGVNRNRRQKEGLVFDLTVTYRKNSDIPTKNLFIWKKIPRDGAIYDTSIVSMEILQKRKLVAWMASNCKSFSKREKYVDELSKYIKVDIYGLCGDLICSRDEDCFSMIEENYNFYLSFENSVCPDYVTEKLENVLRKNIVPIVYGGANYSEYAPPNSVINIEDYPNPKDLAKYLEKLVSNHTKYNAYLNWKNTYTISKKRWGGNWWCTMCEYLHTNEKYNQIYDDVEEWWGPDGLDKYCNEQKMMELMKRGGWYKKEKPLVKNQLSVHG